MSHLGVKKMPEHPQFVRQRAEETIGMLRALLESALGLAEQGRLTDAQIARIRDLGRKA